MIRAAPCDAIGFGRDDVIAAETAHLRYLLRVPAGRVSGARLLVSVHGVTRNCVEHLDRFLPAADARNAALLVPLFSESRFPDYQRLGRAGRGDRADLALRGTLDLIGRQYGLDTRRPYLFGHSGGAQFVHRYVMAWPEDVAGYVASAAGWYTMPDPSRPFPYGIGPCPDLPNLRFDADRFLTVPGTVLVGGGDVRRGRHLRADPDLDAIQGANRLERARHWTVAMNQEAAARGLPGSPVSLHVLPEIGHRFTAAARAGAVGEAVNRLLGAQC